MTDIARILDEEILAAVEKPGQYIGGELNSRCKNWDEVKVKGAFLFPDFYEIGMSHLGLRLLYTAVNNCDDLLLERSFCPMPDLEAELKKRGLPLFSWESRRSLGDFDLLGITLQYEMSYTNVLNMLSQASLPLFSKDRGDGWDYPLVTAGGPCAFNAEVLAPFIDLFMLGEGEEVLPALMRLLGEVKEAGGTKSDFLRQAAKRQGIYVPAFYDVTYDERGAVADIKAQQGAALPVVKTVVADFDAAVFADDCLLPYTSIVHDRMMLEIMRGCTRGCRFCQAGMIYRPVREPQHAFAARGAAGGKLRLRRAGAAIAVLCRLQLHRAADRRPDGGF